MNAYTMHLQIHYYVDAMHHKQCCSAHHTLFQKDESYLCLKSLEIYFLKKGQNLMFFDIMDDIFWK